MFFCIWGVGFMGWCDYITVNGVEMAAAAKVFHICFIPLIPYEVWLINRPPTCYRRRHTGRKFQKNVCCRLLKCWLVAWLRLLCLGLLFWLKIPACNRESVLQDCGLNGRLLNDDDFAPATEGGAGDKKKDQRSAPADATDSSSKALPVKNGPNTQALVDKIGIVGDQPTEQQLGQLVALGAALGAKNRVTLADGQVKTGMQVLLWVASMAPHMGLPLVKIGLMIGVNDRIAIPGIKDPLDKHGLAREALNRTRDNAIVWNEAGVFLGAATNMITLNDGRVVNCVECFRQAIAIKPDFAIAMRNLAIHGAAKGPVMVPGQPVPIEKRMLLMMALQAKPDYGTAMADLANTLEAPDQKIQLLNGQLMSKRELYAQACNFNPALPPLSALKGLQKMLRPDESLTLLNGVVVSHVTLPQLIKSVTARKAVGKPLPKPATRAPEAAAPVAPGRTEEPVAAPTTVDERQPPPEEENPDEYFAEEDGGGNGEAPKDEEENADEGTTRVEVPPASGDDTQDTNNEGAVN